MAAIVACVDVRAVLQEYSRNADTAMTCRMHERGPTKWVYEDGRRNLLRHSVQQFGNSDFMVVPNGHVQNGKACSRIVATALRRQWQALRSRPPQQLTCNVRHFYSGGARTTGSNEIACTHATRDPHHSSFGARTQRSRYANRPGVAFDRNDEASSNIATVIAQSAPASIFRLTCAWVLRRPQRPGTP